MFVPSPLTSHPRCSLAASTERVLLGLFFFLRRMRTRCNLHVRTIQAPSPGHLPPVFFYLPPKSPPPPGPHLGLDTSTRLLPPKLGRRLFWSPDGICRAKSNQMHTTCFTYFLFDLSLLAWFCDGLNTLWVSVEHGCPKHHPALRTNARYAPPPLAGWLFTNVLFIEVFNPVVPPPKVFPRVGWVGEVLELSSLPFPPRPLSCGLAQKRQTLDLAPLARI